MKTCVCTEGDIVLRALKLVMDNFAPAGIVRDECIRVVDLLWKWSRWNRQWRTERGVWGVQTHPEIPKF